MEEGVLTDKIHKWTVWAKKVWLAASGAKLYLFCATLLYGIYSIFFEFYFLVLQRPKKTYNFAPDAAINTFLTHPVGFVDIYKTVQYKFYIDFKLWSKVDTGHLEN